MQFLRELNVSEGFKRAKARLCRPSSGRDTILPSKTLVKALLRRRGVTVESEMTKDEMITVFITGKDSID
jgi:hypothetical protein